jgi:hypothetical protein
VIVYLQDLLHGGRVYEGAYLLLLNGKDDAVNTPYTKGRPAPPHRLQSVLDLE